MNSMCVPKILILLQILSISTLYAQDAPSHPPQQPTERIIGGVSDGKPSAKSAPAKKLPSYKIHWTKREMKNGREVILNRVQAPAPLPVAQETQRPLTTAEIKARREHLKKWELDYRTQLGGMFAVSATVHDHRATLVRWIHQGKNFTAWSNVDWNHLGGFHTFEARNKRYTMLLFSANYSMAQLRKEQQAGHRITLPEIPKLPPIAQGARYTITEGDTDNEEAMEFIEAIHDLYETHQQQLTRAYQLRLKNRKIQQLRREQLRKNPPPKPPLVINYWKKKTPAQKPPATNASSGKPTPPVTNASSGTPTSQKGKEAK